jgi:hypothetical protein
LPDENPERITAEAKAWSVSLACDKAEKTKFQREKT